MNTFLEFYFYSSCDIVAHLDCAMDKRTEKDIDLLTLTDWGSSGSKKDSELEGSNDCNLHSQKNIVGEDKIEFAIEIEYFSHMHDLMLADVDEKKKCNGCLWTILPLFYCCAKWSSFLHKCCTN